LFGPKGESGAAKQSFFDLMLKAAQGKAGLEIVNEEVSCFTYTPDLAMATKKLVESDKGFGIYHLINPGPATWYQAAVELFRLAGVTARVAPVKADKFPRPAKRPKFSTLLNTKFEALRPWKDALAEYLKGRE
jgi:dTDP-4-dehydrorhamnose reductase